MRSLRAGFGRGYATGLKRPPPANARLKYPPRTPALLKPIAAVARTQSTPLAVRKRRAKASGFTPLFTESDVTSAHLSPSDQARYNRFKALGALLRYDGTELTEREWITAINRRRTRIRGLWSEALYKPSQIVGHRIYLPNFIMRLVRNNTPPGQPYNPYEATFRVPLNITKTDVRSFLYTVYGVLTTYIRTDIHRESRKRQKRAEKQAAAKQTPQQIYENRTFKRVVVGLVDPFHFPQAMEDMSETTRQEREDWIEDKFHLKYMKESYKQEEKMHLHAFMNGRRVKDNALVFGTEGRKKILKAIWEKRRAREQATDMLVGQMQEARAQGRAILVEASPVEEIKASESSA